MCEGYWKESLCRNSAFFGVSGIIAPSKNSPPLSAAVSTHGIDGDTDMQWQVSKASVGGMEWMDIHCTHDLSSFLQQSRRHGWQVLGTSLSDSSRHLAHTHLQQPSILVLGNEAFGLRPEIARQCDVMVCTLQVHYWVAAGEDSGYRGSCSAVSQCRGQHRHLIVSLTRCSKQYQQQ